MFSPPKTIPNCSLCSCPGQVSSEKGELSVPFPDLLAIIQLGGNKNTYSQLSPDLCCSANSHQKSKSNNDARNLNSRVRTWTGNTDGTGRGATVRRGRCEKWACLGHYKCMSVCLGYVANFSSICRYKFDINCHGM